MENADSDSDDGNVSKLTWNKLQNACHSVNFKILICVKVDTRLNTSIFFQQGYLEGLTEGKEQKLQEGFDQGYLAGFQQSQRLAEIKGFLSAIMLKNSSDVQLSEKFKTAIAEINNDSNQDCLNTNMISSGFLINKFSS